MIILKEIFGPLIWIAFNKSWHSIAHCQRWPGGKSLLVRFLLNWEWQGMLGALLLLFVTNENFSAEFSCWRLLICVFSQPEEGEKNPMKHNLLCHDFSIASRWFWVTIGSLVCRSQTLLTALFIREWVMRNRSCCTVTQNLGVWIHGQDMDISWDLSHVYTDVWYHNTGVEASDTFLMTKLYVSLDE